MRRWAVPVLGLAAAVLFGYVATHRVPVEPPAPAPAPAATELPQLTGGTQAGPAGLRLLVSGAEPRLLDGARGSSAPVPGLRLGAGERARLQAVPAGTVATVSGPGPTRAVLLTGSAAVPLGNGVTVLAARTGTDLWVAGPGPGSAASGGTTGTAGSARTRVRLVTPAGATRRSWFVPGRLTLLGDTAGGLLASVTGTGEGGRLVQLDPATGAERRLIGAGVLVVAVGPTAVAHVLAGCAGSCPLVVSPLAAGSDRDYALPAGTPGGGAFSPDGRWLALAVPGQYRNGRLAVVPGYAEVVDLASGRVSEVPGVRTAAERVADLSWHGGTLVVAVWSADRGRLAVWTPATPGPLAVLPYDLPGDDRCTALALP